MAPHLNSNSEKAFPGIELQVYEKPITLGGLNFLATLRLIADMQPENFEFTATKSKFAGLVGGTLSMRTTNFLYAYVSMDAKTKGWVAGNAFLDDRLSIRAGLSFRFFYGQN